MTSIRWENVPDSEVRAEVEAVLESQGEAKRINQFLNSHPDIEKWRQQIKSMCQSLINEKGIDNLTPDLIYDQIAASAHELIPESVYNEVKEKLVSFLQTQFEDHI